MGRGGEGKETDFRSGPSVGKGPERGTRGERHIHGTGARVPGAESSAEHMATSRVAGENRVHSLRALEMDVWLLPEAPSDNPLRVPLPAPGGRRRPSAFLGLRTHLSSPPSSRCLSCKDTCHWI